MSITGIRWATLGATLAWSAQACVEPFDVDEPAWMVATVLEADSSTDYAGGGSFYLPRTRFTIDSNGRGDAAGQRVTFYRSQAGRAPAGHYDFAPSDDGGRQFTGVYFRPVGGEQVEGYLITGGRLSITSSNADRVEGSFHFTAELYCTLPGQACDPGRLVEGAPPIEVNGSFSVGKPGPMCPGAAREDGTSACG